MIASGAKTLTETVINFQMNGYSFIIHNGIILSHSANIIHPVSCWWISVLPPA
jgi:hypothetical protein